jgi:GTP cyclohydrolase IA
MGSIDREAAAKAIESFLRALGHDPGERALAGTGSRVASLWLDELIEGERKDPAAILAEAMPAGPDAPVVVVEGLSTHVVCPHHLTIATGSVDVAYLPNARIVGLGSIASLVDAFAHRLALQEDVGRDIANALVEHLAARAAAVGIRLTHPCLALHGEKKREASVRTLAMAGTAIGAGADRDLLLAALGRSPRTQEHPT